MTHITQPTLLEEMRKTEEFMRTNFTPLAGTVEKALDAFVQMYIEAGAPYGSSPDIREMQDKAITWIEEMHNLAAQEETEYEEQARLDMYLQEATKSGDIVIHDGLPVWTPLGITRWLVVELHVLLTHAEEQQRGYTNIESSLVSKKLAHAFYAVQSYEEMFAGEHHGRK